MDTTKTKSIFTSKTVLGVVTMVVGSVAPVVAARYGYTFTAEDGASVLDLVGKCVEMVGAALAIYGRVKATHTIA